MRKLIRFLIAVSLFLPIYASAETFIDKPMFFDGSSYIVPFILKDDFRPVPFALKGDFKISFRIKFKKLPSSEYIICGQDKEPGSGWLLRFVKSGRGQGYCFRISANDREKVFTLGSAYSRKYKPGVWYRVEITKEKDIYTIKTRRKMIKHKDKTGFTWDYGERLWIGFFKDKPYDLHLSGWLDKFSIEELD